MLGLILMYLFKTGTCINVNTRGAGGRTALMVAATWPRESTVRLLLEAGANITARDEDGATAVHLAAQLGHDDVVRTLLGQGLNVREPHERTALLVARRANITLHLAAQEDIRTLHYGRGGYIYLCLKS